VDERSGVLLCDCVDGKETRLALVAMYKPVGALAPVAWLWILPRSHRVSAPHRSPPTWADLVAVEQRTPHASGDQSDHLPSRADGSIPYEGGETDGRQTYFR